VKGTVRDESTWDVTNLYGSNTRNLCIAILISTSKNALSSLLLLMLSLQQNKGRIELPGSEGQGVGGNGGAGEWGEK
jgi:hypothetical protein